MSGIDIRDLLPMRGMRICSESFLLLGVMGLIIASFILGRGCTGRGQDIVQASDTISRVDTFMDTVYSCTVLPVPYYIEKLRTDTILTPRGDTVLIAIESKAYRDTLSSEGDTAIIRSWVSGHRASLDSLKAEWRKKRIIETITITNTVEKKQSRIGIYAGPQVGIDPINGKAALSIGIGIGYKIW